MRTIAGSRPLRLVTLLFALLQLSVLAAGPAVDTLLHTADANGERTSDVHFQSVPHEFGCGLCLLNATPGLAASPLPVPHDALLPAVAALPDRVAPTPASALAAPSARAPPLG